MSNKKISSTNKRTNKKKSEHKYSFLAAAAVILLTAVVFVVGSKTGAIETFLTPEELIIKNNLPADVDTTASVVKSELVVNNEKTVQPGDLTENSSEETTTEYYTPSYYVITVNTAYNVVTVYVRGSKINNGDDPADPKDDEYELEPVRAFICSTGYAGQTPLGTFYLSERNDWCFMYGDVYARFATRIVDGIMFHSVPYYTRDAGDLETDQYNILGYAASSGCVRLTCEAANWIFNNCAAGTEVRIIEDWNNYCPIEPDPVYSIPTDIEQLSGWDPTDVWSSDNPWLYYSAYLTNAVVSLPLGASVDDLLLALGPTDGYGNDLSNYFYTDGGYSLWTPGSYDTVGHIKVANLTFSFDITIIVADDGTYYSYDDTGYYEDNTDYYEDNTDYYEEYTDYYEDYTDYIYEENTDYGDGYGY